MTDLEFAKREMDYRNAWLNRVDTLIRRACDGEDVSSEDATVLEDARDYAREHMVEKQTWMAAAVPVLERAMEG